MKKYRLIAIIMMALYSCTENQLDKTIFIPDEDDSNLPAYTEWGYNSFGAKYERTYFFSATNIIPCKIVYQDGILHFSLSGYLFFKRIQLLRVDDKEDRVILSGLFDLSFMRNEFSEYLSNGRFDLGVNQYFTVLPN